MPENNNTGEIIETPWEEDYWEWINSTLQPIITHTQGAIASQPAGGGLMEAIQQSEQLPTYYEEASLDSLHRKMVTDWGLAYPEKPVTKLIKDDEDMGTKPSSNKDMKPLEKEEIEKALWKEEPNLYFLKNLLENNKESRMIPIGSIGSGNLERLPLTNNNWLIIAHRLNGKVITTNKESIEILVERNIKKEYVLYNLQTKKIQLFRSDVTEAYLNTSKNNKNILNQLFKYKIIGSTLSGRTFGLGKIKATLVGTIIENIKLEFGDSVRLGTNTWYAVIQDPTSEKSIKFCLSDLEIILPNIKGYNFPKDRTIRKGSSVVLKNNLNTVYKVTDIYVNTSSQRLMKNSQTRKLDVLQLVNINNPYDTNKVYAKNVKIVE